MPKIAAFPKAYMDALCIDGSMKVEEWIRLAATLDIDGLEFYSGFLEMEDPKNWSRFRSMVEEYGMCIPMLCCSPDFTHPDPDFRRQQIELEKKWIDMTAALGGKYCRVLSGQKRPELSEEEGIQYTIECIEACLPYAENNGIHLVIENHYKDNYWTYPEFAQMSKVFVQIVNGISNPFFGVNFDPSNTILAGEDPLELLEKTKHRILTMHASDRYLAHGTIEDLRKQENSVGYASMLRHGEIGKGLNDYDKIFETLKSVGFDNWISIEDGVDGFDQLQRSVAFLKNKISKFWN